MLTVNSNIERCYSATGVKGIVGLSVDSSTLKRTILEVTQKISDVLLDIIASYIPKHEGVFGESDWNELCGRVAPAPLLPQDIEKIWEGPCPIFQGKRIKETHVLVYLPTTVDHKPLNWITLVEIVKPYCVLNINRIGKHFWNMVMKKEEIRNQSLDTSCWVLMTKTVIDNSRMEDYATQLTMIEELAKKAEVPYTIPTSLQATICILTHYMRTRARLFEERNYSKVSTRCQDHVQVGHFSKNGLLVLSENHCILDAELGVAALRILDH